MKFAIVAAVAFLSAWIPLVGSYHYEAAVSTALLGLVCIPILAPRVNDATRAQKRKTVALCLASATLFFLSANGIYLAIAFFTNQLCDILQGMAYQLLIALPSNLLAAAVLAWGQSIFKHRPPRIVSYLLFIAIDFGFVLYALYNWPPIVAFGQFIGYFAGSIYDESIDVFNGLIAYRLGTLAVVILWIYGACGRLCRQILVPIVCVALSFGYHLYLAHTGTIPPIAHDDVDSALWAKIDTPRYCVHYVPHSKNRAAMAQERARLARDYERDYQTLKSFFNAEPAQKMTIYHYPDAETKGRYLGAVRTSFARLWNNEIHVVEGAPDSTLPRHEMAHLFAASFSTSTLGVAGGWFPSLGWTEGLAMAAEWPIDAHDLHAWAYGILQNQELFGHIDPVEIMYGFWGLPSRVAYTLAGSFVRWLVDRYGIETVKQMSNIMPGDFEEKFDISFRNLFELWQLDIRRTRAGSRAADQVRVVFTSQSIWTRRCARTRAFAQIKFSDCLRDNSCSNRISDDLLRHEFCSKNPDNLNDDLIALEMLYARYIAHGAVDSPSLEAAILSPNGILSIFRESLSSGLKRGQRRVSMDDICQNRTFSIISAADLRHIIVDRLKLVDPNRLSPAQQIAWHERTADILWHSNQNALAATYYHILLTLDTLPQPTARRIEIKAQAAGTMISPTSQTLRLWFANSLEDAVLTISQPCENAPILAYLSFVNAMNRRDFITARRAYVRVLLHMISADRATQLPPRAWSEFWRLVPYL